MLTSNWGVSPDIWQFIDHHAHKLNVTAGFLHAIPKSRAMVSPLITNVLYDFQVSNDHFYEDVGKLCSHLWFEHRLIVIADR